MEHLPYKRFALCDTPTTPQFTWFRSIFFVCAILINVTIIFMNAALIVIMIMRKTHKKRSNRYIFRLVICDLVYGILSIPFAISDTLGVWSFGETWCTIRLLADIPFKGTSALLLCVISIDRFFAVAPTSEKTSFQMESLMQKYYPEIKYNEVDSNELLLVGLSKWYNLANVTGDFEANGQDRLLPARVQEIIGNWTNPSALEKFAEMYTESVYPGFNYLNSRVNGAEFSLSRNVANYSEIPELEYRCPYLCQVSNHPVAVIYGFVVSYFIPALVMITFCWKLYGPAEETNEAMRTGYRNTVAGNGKETDLRLHRGMDVLSPSAAPDPIRVKGKRTTRTQTEPDDFEDNPVGPPGSENIRLRVINPRVGLRRASCMEEPIPGTIPEIQTTSFIEIPKPSTTHVLRTTAVIEPIPRDISDISTTIPIEKPTPSAGSDVPTIITIEKPAPIKSVRRSESLYAILPADPEPVAETTIDIPTTISIGEPILRDSPDISTTTSDEEPRDGLVIQTTAIIEPIPRDISNISTTPSLEEPVPRDSSDVPTIIEIEKPAPIKSVRRSESLYAILPADPEPVAETTIDIPTTISIGEPILRDSPDISTTTSDEEPRDGLVIQTTAIIEPIPRDISNISTTPSLEEPVPRDSSDVPTIIEIEEPIPRDISYISITPSSEELIPRDISYISTTPSSEEPLLRDSSDISTTSSSEELIPRDVPYISTTPSPEDPKPRDISFVSTTPSLEEPIPSTSQVLQTTAAIEPLPRDISDISTTIPIEKPTPSAGSDVPTIIEIEEPILRDSSDISITSSLGESIPRDISFVSTTPSLEEPIPSTSQVLQTTAAIEPLPRDISNISPSSSMDEPIPRDSLVIRTTAIIEPIPRDISDISTTIPIEKPTPSAGSDVPTIITIEKPAPIKSVRRRESLYAILPADPEPAEITIEETITPEPKTFLRSLMEKIPFIGKKEAPFKVFYKVKRDKSKKEPTPAAGKQGEEVEKITMTTSWTQTDEKELRKLLSLWQRLREKPAIAKFLEFAKKFRIRSKAAKVLCVLVGTFTIFWMPYNTLILIRAFCLDCVSNNTLVICYWFGLLAIVSNPFIYGFALKEHRQIFVRYFRYMFCGGEHPRTYNAYRPGWLAADRAQPRRERVRPEF